MLFRSSFCGNICTVQHKTCMRILQRKQYHRTGGQAKLCAVILDPDSQFSVFFFVFCQIPLMERTL